MRKINIGTSGYIYVHWKGTFYPEDLPKSKWFGYYAERFDTVEINNSFYKLPEKSTFEKWRDRAPEDFLYAVKANRYLTHMKNLNEPEEPWDNMWSHAKLLGENLGPILLQLSPNWHSNPERLQNFIDILPDNLLAVFEFRDSTWNNDEIFEILDKSGHTLCLCDMQGNAPERIMIGDFVYIRFHGITGKYEGEYGDENLKPWAEWLHENALEKGKPVFAYFNNDDSGFATKDAKRLREMLEKF